MTLVAGISSVEDIPPPATVVTICALADIDTANNEIKRNILLILRYSIDMLYIIQSTPAAPAGGGAPTGNTKTVPTLYPGPAPG